MGHAHYFAYTPKAESFRSVWLQLRLDAAAIIDLVEGAEGIALAGGAGTGAPRIDEEAIVFNGLAAADGDYETFSIELDPQHEDERGFTYSFCKTGFSRPRPYNVAVTAVMLRAHTLAPDCFAIDSDGDWDEEWLYARAIHRMLFGTDPGMASPFTSQLHSTGPVAARF
ncbi:hypothetical protein [Streptomyces marianii]|uniref:Uncharacterized protein n=1 Tax=Streptomyces marianii TaxID=1817406 RepID=A0A5R9DRJ6_9ACTN|nr:hypothetical protein [Streptomyces marianii]TLQ39210.1 hypothetical protein FEF34_38065 [Streptomyces marianii]